MGENVSYDFEDYFKEELIKAFEEVGLDEDVLENF